ncbi:hypothetical protein ACJ41O_007321 [Fusarium nematophilum]
MLVAGWEPAGHVTVSNCLFDGQSDWSVTCDGHHYWGMLMIGREDYYTFSGNYLHHLSGRAPHYGTDKDDATNVFHAVNNLFESITGHAFDIEPSTWSVLEGNVFDDVKEPVSSYSTESGRDNQIWIGSGSECESAFGRPCEDNLVTGESRALHEVTSSDSVARASEEGGVTPTIVVDKVAASIKANAGVGKLFAARVSEPAATIEKDDKPAATAESEDKAVDSASSAPQPTTLVSVVAAPSASADTGSQERSVPLWGRCGGEGYDGPTTCAEGSCTEVNQWYSQCL